VISYAIEVEVRELTTPDDLAACSNLYPSAFTLRPEDGSLNPRLLMGIARNGGIVVGAFAEGTLIGFAFSFLAQRSQGGALYQYSQNAAVLPEWQGRGVGRRLKLAQRAIALGRGVPLIRWVYDPFQVRNAHFNLDVLAAQAIGFERNFYGAYAHGFAPGSTSPRMIVEWSLDSERVEKISDGAPSTPRQFDNVPALGEVLRHKDGRVTLSVPTAINELEPTLQVELRGAIGDTFESLLSEGLVGVSCCRVDEKCAAYLFEPWRENSERSKET
jgi:predicted GNAT superfamily acetyltransferase